MAILGEVNATTVGKVARETQFLQGAMKFGLDDPRLHFAHQDMIALDVALRRKMEA